MNRIELKTRQLQQTKSKAFVAYITAGFPNPKVTEQLVLELEKNGVDIIELGLPFSDPVADGSTIQAASASAIKAGMTLRKFLKLVKEVRKKTQIPLIIMSYFNPILRYGLKKFSVDAKKSGLDGVIIPDLPPEESDELNTYLEEKGISQIFLISPVTKKNRMAMIAKKSKGFIYYVPLTGVTGTRNRIPKGIGHAVKTIRKYSKTPVFVGFGISTAEHVRKINRSSDGVIVGSAIIKTLQKNLRNPDLIKNVGKYVKTLTRVKV